MMGKRRKRVDFVRFATAALSSQSAPANYDKMKLLGIHIACQYGVHISSVAWFVAAAMTSNSL